MDAFLKFLRLFTVFVFFQASTRTIRATAQLINSLTQTVNSPKLMGSGHPYSPVLWIQPIPESEQLVFFLSWPYRYLKEDRCRPDLNNRIWFLHLLEFNFFSFRIVENRKWKMFFNSLERTWMVQDQDGKNCGSAYTVTHPTYLQAVKEERKEKDSEFLLFI